MQNNNQVWSRSAKTRNPFDLFKKPQNDLIQIKDCLSQFDTQRCSLSDFLF